MNTTEQAIRQLDPAHDPEVVYGTRAVTDLDAILADVEPVPPARRAWTRSIIIAALGVALVAGGFLAARLVVGDPLRDIEIASVPGVGDPAIRELFVDECRQALRRPMPNNPNGGLPNPATMEQIVSMSEIVLVTVDRRGSYAVLRHDEFAWACFVTGAAGSSTNSSSQSRGMAVALFPDEPVEPPRGLKTLDMRYSTVLGADPESEGPAYLNLAGRAGEQVVGMRYEYPSGGVREAVVADGWFAWSSEEPPQWSRPRQPFIVIVTYTDGSEEEVVLES